MDERQFILRLPPTLAERMSLALSSKKKLDAAAAAAAEPGKFKIDFIDDRTATFSLDGTSYPATMMDLPCIVETHKYTEKRTFYKSGDVGQVLVVRMPGEAGPEETTLVDGITPGSKGSRERFAVPDPVFTPEQVSRVENTLKLVVDNKLPTLVRKKSDPEKTSDIGAGEGGARSATGAANSAAGGGKSDGVGVTGKVVSNEEEIEIVIEPEASSSIGQKQDGKVATKGAAGDKAKSASIGKSASLQSTAEKASGQFSRGGSHAQRKNSGTPGEKSPSSVPKTPVQSSPHDTAVATRDTGPPGEKPSNGEAGSRINVPVPSGKETVEREGTDDDDDEFANMLAESMLETPGDEPNAGPTSASRPEMQNATDATAARVARATVAKNIEAKKAQIASEEAAISRAPNPVLKSRHARRKSEFVTQLKALETEAASLI